MRDSKGKFLKGERSNPRGEFKKGKYVGFGFKKGQAPWNKGKKTKPLTEETRKKLSENHKGKNTWSKGRQSWNYIDGRSKTASPARYGDDWNKIRHQVYLRDNFTCQGCGKTGISMDVHHIIPFLETHNNSIENLVTLCRCCHMKIENNILKKIKNKED